MFHHVPLPRLAPMLAVAALIVVGAAPSGAAGTLDQAQTSDSAGAECVCEPHSRLAQTFTAGRSGDLDRVDLLL